jgi:hypothetical protein
MRNLRSALDRLEKRVPRPSEDAAPRNHLIAALDDWTKSDDFHGEGQRQFAEALMVYCREEGERRGTEPLDPHQVLDSLEHLALLTEAAD